MKRHRRVLRALFAALVVVGCIGTWDQRAIGRAGGPARERAIELASGWDGPWTGDLAALAARLRVPEAPAPDQGTLASEAAASLPTASVDSPIVAPPRVFHAAPGPAVAPPPGLQPSQYADVAPSGGTWALVIGIDDYPGAGYDLRSAVKDADAVDEALARLGVTADRRMVLRDRQASAGVIRAALDWLTAHAGADATMVVFYAGHVQKLGQGTEAVVGADGGLVRDTELAALLDRSPATRAWIAIAGCYAGGFTEVLEPGRILTAAAPADQPAYENETLGHSYLVEYMVQRAMLDQGITTVESAFGWATAQLQRDHPDRQPVQFDQFSGNFDLRIPSPAPTSPAGTPPSGGSAPAPSSGPSSPAPDDGCADLTVGVVRCKR